MMVLNRLTKSSPHRRGSPVITDARTEAYPRSSCVYKSITPPVTMPRHTDISRVLVVISALLAAADNNTYLVTGAAGCLGSHVAIHLMDDGYHQRSNTVSI